MNLMQVSLVQHATAAGFDGAVVGAQLFEHAKVEARCARGLHIGPRYGVLGIEPDFDLLVLPLKHPLYHSKIDRCVHDFLPFLGVFKNFLGVFKKRVFCEF
jgi:hypothetical protein